MQVDIALLKKCIITVTCLIVLTCCSKEDKLSDPLPSWNKSPVKEAILEFVQKTIDKTSGDFVPAEERIAVFDQDGTLWVEHPIPTQLIYCIDRLEILSKTKPELKETEPFKSLLNRNPDAIANLSANDFEKIAEMTLTGMSTDEFYAEVKNWISTAKDSRWKRLYTELTYRPMKEVLSYLRANGYRTYIVTGGGQDFVRVYSEQVYGILPEQVVGTASATKFGYDEQGKPILTKESALLFNDNYAGKPEGIHLMIGQRPFAAFGNSTGDRAMLEYTTAGKGKRLAMLVLHDDAIREYAYGPAQGLPDTKVGTFTQELYDEAVKNNWVVISMKNDWKQIFDFEEN